MSEGTIKFACECGKAYKVPEAYAGKRVVCKVCGEKVAVPSSSESVSSARASAVSQRSVVSSKRVPAEDEDEKPKKSSSKLAASGSARLPSGSGKVASSGAGKTSAKLPSAAPARKPGGDTQVFEAIDLTQEKKKYERKRDEDIAKATAKLTYFENGKATKSFRLDKDPKTLGRSSSSDIKLESKSVSKSHVRFEYMMGMFIATDTQSTNGVVVNGKKVRRASLKDGDVLQLGEVVLRIDCGK